MSDERYKNNLKKAVSVAAIALPIFTISSCYALFSDSKYKKVVPIVAGFALAGAAAGALTVLGKRTIDNFFD